MRTVSELMTREVVAIQETQNLARAGELLGLHHIRHLPVVREGKLVGLITHRDLLRAAAERWGADPTRKPLWAADIMVRDVKTARPETPLREAVRVMLENKYGCLPVVEEDGKLRGILTEADLVRYAQQLVADMDLHEQAAAYEP
jgi:CBS domain-containing protein